VATGHERFAIRKGSADPCRAHTASRLGTTQWPVCFLLTSQGSFPLPGMTCPARVRSVPADQTNMGS
jgi:hypothetical protein